MDKDSVLEFADAPLASGPPFHAFRGDTEPHVPTYTVRAVDHHGRVVGIASADQASLALSSLRDALDRYPRAWVVDVSGEDVSLEELARRAGQEKENQHP